ncbi:hypothetical protein BX600DRAFT_387382 [Xylariales sp. PMI_506]|nr:hypothetical protein BX600DRAFT_387382 [Xylariales sp. PMI_506]
MATERRRRRPAVSCTLCRRRKIKCNKETRCSNCVRSKNKVCVYNNLPDAPHRPRPRPSPQEYVSDTSAAPSVSGSGLQVPQFPIAFGSEPWSGDASDTTAVASYPGSASHPESTNEQSPTASQQSTWTVDSLKNRIKQLEKQLSSALPTHPANHGSSAPSELGYASTMGGQMMAMDRGTMSKTRLFGQTHWMNGAWLLKPMWGSFTRLEKDPNWEVMPLLNKCKSLGRIIKSHRIPVSAGPNLHDVPPREIADKLVDGYLRTMERIYRVLHIPSFQKEYEAFWSSPDNSSPIFILKLKLVMAVGAAVYDDQFSFRSQAVNWVHEAHVWISAPSSKDRLTIPCLQIMILMCLARETSAVGGDLIWITAGSLLRSAMYMGLHRDPSRIPKTNHFTAEMRRRLWNTIIEICLQSSIDSGGPPLMSLNDFDAEPPGNYDDEQLSPVGPISMAKTSECYTDTSIAIALRHTFPIRLTIIKFLNEFRSPDSYSETLRLDAELKAAYRKFTRTLNGFAGGSDVVSMAPSGFELRLVDFIIRRYFLTLHVPYFGHALCDATYAFSRRVVVDSALRLWQLVDPVPSPPLVVATPDRGVEDMIRMATNAAGCFRSVPIQAALSITVELRSQILEDTGVGGPPIFSARPDLVAVLHGAQEWCLRRIRAGETNIKGYLGLAVTAAHIDGLRQSMSREELDRIFAVATEDAARNAVAVLEETARQYDTGSDAGSGRTAAPTVDKPTNMTALGSTSEAEEEWDMYDSVSYFLLLTLR